MQSNTIKCLLIALTFMVYGFAAVAEPSGTVKGRITDSEGAAIKGAHLLFHMDTSGRNNSAPSVDVVRETDTMGDFEVQLESGFYDVCIMAKAFTPECRKILVSKEGHVHLDTHL